MLYYNYIKLLFIYEYAIKGDTIHAHIRSIIKCNNLFRGIFTFHFIHYFFIKRGPDLLFFQFGISLFFGAQIIIGMKFFHNYGFSFHSKLELLIFIFYVIGFITCILLFFHFQNPYRIFLLICSFLFLTGFNYYFKETLNFSKKIPNQHKTF